MVSLTDKVNNTICDTKGAGSLDTTAQLDYLCSQLAIRGVLRVETSLELQVGEVLLGKLNKAGTDVLSDQVFGRRVGPLHRDLHLELASSEAELHDGFAAGSRGLSALLFRRDLAREPPLAVDGAYTSIVLLDLVVASDAEIDLALSNERGDIGSGEEDQGDGKVLDESNVEAVLSPELDVGSLEQVERCAIQSSLWSGVG